MDFLFLRKWLVEPNDRNQEKLLGNVQRFLNEYNSLRRKKGSSIAIAVKDDGAEILFNWEHLDRLRKLSKKYPDTCAYIADAISLSELVKFESEEIIDELDALTWEK